MRTAPRSERFLVAALRDYVRKAEQEKRYLAIADTPQKLATHASASGARLKVSVIARIALVIVKGLLRAYLQSKSNCKQLAESHIHFLKLFFYA